MPAKQFPGQGLHVRVGVHRTQQVELREGVGERSRGTEDAPHRLTEAFAPMCRQQHEPARR
jgi:hypothetical protein